MRDSLVVRADELRTVLAPYVQAQNVAHREALYGGEWHDEHGSPILAGSGWLAHATGLNERSVRRILQSDQQWVTLTLADKLLTAAGLNQALRDGRCRVVPNPLLTLETWAARIRACGVENPDEVL
jgi:hypothetical protein